MDKAVSSTTDLMFIQAIPLSAQVWSLFIHEQNRLCLNSPESVLLCVEAVPLTERKGLRRGMVGLKEASTVTAVTFSFRRTRAWRPPGRAQINRRSSRAMCKSTSQVVTSTARQLLIIPTAVSSSISIIRTSNVPLLLLQK